MYGSKRIGGQGLAVFLKQIEKDKEDKKSFLKNWKNIVYGYEQAVDYLTSEFKVTQLRSLPTQNIYTMLSYFFFLNQRRPTKSQIKEIRKWFWHTGCGERYSGAKFNRNIPKDIEFFRKLSKNKNTKYNIEEKIDTLPFLKTNYRTSSTSSSVTSYFLMLRQNKPLYVANASEMLLDNPTNISNRKDRHHIFPEALLKRNSISSTWTNALMNICYLESDENQSFSDGHPKDYLTLHKRRKHFAKVMKSHLIPYSNKSPIWIPKVRLAYKGFLNERAYLIITKFNKLAGAKIFQELDTILRIA